MMHKTPLEELVERQVEELERTAEMEAELRKYARPVKAGYMMTIGDLARYFADKGRGR